MTKSPPHNERDRLLALQRYELMDTPPEAVYDDITALAAQICGTPIALISLLDDARQWFKSRVGLEAEETPRDIAFCDHAIRGDDLFVVSDAASDERFRNNPLVTTDPNIRFYAGMPLTCRDGFNLGTLCVIDRESRDLTPEQEVALTALARQVVLQFELRYSLAQEQKVREELYAQFEERSALEVAQRKARQFLRGVLDALRDHIAIVDQRGDIIDVNDAWREFALSNGGSSTLLDVGVGANYLEVCDKADRDKTGDDQAKQVARALRAVLNAGEDKEHSIEYPCHAPGEKRWFVARISPLQVEGQQYAVVSHHNITARKLAEDETRALNVNLEERVNVRTRQVEAAYQRLSDSERRFRQLFEGAAVGLAIIDAEMHIQDCNAAFGGLLGGAPHSLIGRALPKSLHTKDLAEFEAMNAALVGGESVRLVRDLRFKRSDGATVWVTSSAIAIRDGEGAYLRTLILVQDISARKLVEYERDQFFERSADMFALIGFDGTLQRFNPKFCAVLGFDQDELAGKQYIDLIVPEQRARVQHLFAGLLERSRLDMPWLDMRMKLKSGGERTVRWTVAIWREERRVISVGHDVTDTLQQKEALKALTNRLNQIREQERSRISREIHDHLGQLLTALKMDLSLLDRDLNSASRRDGQTLQADVSAMIGLVDETLQSVRRIAQELRPEILDVLGLAAAVEWQAQEFQDRSDTVCVVTQRDVPALSDVQVTELFRIVQEALTNVARHAAASRVEIGITGTGDGLELEIRDDGAGFDSRGGGELSLGLLGMRQRAESIGAKLTLESAIGEGTRICVQLPLGGEE